MKNQIKSYGNNSTNINYVNSLEINGSLYQSPVKIEYTKKTLRCIPTSPKKITNKVFSIGGLIITYISLFVDYPLDIKENISVIMSLPFLIIIVFSILITCSILKTKGFIPFLGSHSLESDGKRIFIKKTKAKCPNCNSKMRIYRDHRGTIISCQRNPERHTYSYDNESFVDNV